MKDLSLELEVLHSQECQQIQPHIFFFFLLRRKRRRAVDGTEEKENAMGAYRQPNPLTEYLFSQVMLRYELTYSYFRCRSHTGCRNALHQRQRKQQQNKSTSTLHSRKYCSWFFDPAIDKLPKRFLFLFHRQRRIFFFFDMPKKKKMGG